MLYYSRIYFNKINFFLNQKQSSPQSLYEAHDPLILFFFILFFGRPTYTLGPKFWNIWTPFNLPLGLKSKWVMTLSASSLFGKNIIIFFLENRNRSMKSTQQVSFKRWLINQCRDLIPSSKCRNLPRLRSSVILVWSSRSLKLRVTLIEEFPLNVPQSFVVLDGLHKEKVALKS